MSGITMCDGFNNYIKGTTGSIRSFRDLVNANGKVYDLSGYVGGCDGKLYNKASKDSMKATYRNHVDKYFEENDLDVILYGTNDIMDFHYVSKNGSTSAKIDRFNEDGTRKLEFGQFRKKMNELEKEVDNNE